MSTSIRTQLRGVRDKLFPRDGNALGCGKKTRYVDEPEAKKVIAKRQRENPGGPVLRAYGCADCGGWHLTKRV